MSSRIADREEYAAAAGGLDQAGNGNGAQGLDGATSFSVIDRHSKFDGTFHSDRDLRIEGEVKGTIECQGTLFVAQGSTVSARVQAENIAVAGDLNGDINCVGRLQIMPSGRVRGKVVTQLLVINEGAYYEGQLEMARPDERRATPAPAPRSLPPSGVASPVPLSNAGAEARPRPAPAASEGGAGSGAASSSTFIRRFGGPETPWDKGASEAEERKDEPGES